MAAPRGADVQGREGVKLLAIRILPSASAAAATDRCLLWMGPWTVGFGLCP